MLEHATSPTPLQCVDRKFPAFQIAASSLNHDPPHGHRPPGDPERHVGSHGSLQKPRRSLHRAGAHPLRAQGPASTWDHDTKGARGPAHVAGQVCEDRDREASHLAKRKGDVTFQPFSPTCQGIRMELLKRIMQSGSAQEPRALAHHGRALLGVWNGRCRAYSP